MNLEIYSSLAVVAVIPVFFGKYFFLPELNSNSLRLLHYYLECFESRNYD